MPRIANYKIESHISTLTPFINYNNSIVATSRDGFYEISHWAMKILTYNYNTGRIEYLYTSNYSQTTSTLVGRILRNLPRESVVRFLVEMETEISNYNRKRLVRMVGL